MSGRNIDIKDVVKVELSQDELNQCISNAQMVLRNLKDRQNLHVRDDLERFNNILMGEIAEFMVIKWLHSNGKYAKSAVDKSSGIPDIGHDLELKRATDGTLIKCSVKSSLSYSKGLLGIIHSFKLATTKSELRDVNIQVYFWLELNPAVQQPRTTVTSLKNAAIIGWFGRNELTTFSAYNHEKREAPDVPLLNARSMYDLLKYIK